MGAPEKSQSNSNSMQRVKVYHLNEDGKWDDRGTGHVSIDYVERSEELSLCVIDEEDNETLLVHPINTEDIYRKQEDTIISWRDPERSTELALSFQETAGCSYVWDQICTMQRNLHFSSLNNRHYVGLDYPPNYKKDLAKIVDLGVHRWSFLNETRIQQSRARVEKVSWPAPPSKMGKVNVQFPNYFRRLVSRGGSKERDPVASSEPPLEVVIGLPHPPGPPTVSGSRQGRATVTGVSDVQPAAVGVGPSRKRPAADRTLTDGPASKSQRVATSVPVPPEAVLPEAPPLDPTVVPETVGPSSYAFDFSYTGDSQIVCNKDECVRLLRMIRADPVSEMPPIRDEFILEKYKEFARHTARGLAHVNGIIEGADERVMAAQAALEAAQGELATAKEELAIEKAKNVALQDEMKLIAEKSVVDAKVANEKSDAEIDRLRKSQTFVIARERKFYDDLVKKCNSRFRKMRKFVNEQSSVQEVLFELNQITGILDAYLVLQSEGVLVPEEKIKRLLEDKTDWEEKVKTLNIVVFQDGELDDVLIPDRSTPVVPVEGNTSVRRPSAGGVVPSDGVTTREVAGSSHA